MNTDWRIDEVCLHAQPIVRIGSDGEAEVVAYEVLARHPRMGPLDLLRSSDSRRTSLQLARYLRERSAEIAAELPEGRELYVNVRARDLRDGQLFDPKTPLAEMAIKGRVTIELTERERLDNIEDYEQRVNKLRDLGYSVAIDDMGAGYANFAVLIKIAARALKLDMLLIRGIDHTVRGFAQRTIVRNVVRCGRQLGMLVIAEGVETLEESLALRRLGCDLQQGYLFARPAPPFPEVARLAA